MAYELTYFLPGAGRQPAHVIEDLRRCLDENGIAALYVPDSSGEGWVAGDLTSDDGTEPVMIEAHVGPRVARLWEDKVAQYDVPAAGAAGAMVSVVLSGHESEGVVAALRQHFRTCVGAAEFDDVEGYLPD